MPSVQLVLLPAQQRLASGARPGVPDSRPPMLQQCRLHSSASSARWWQSTPRPQCICRRQCLHRRDALIQASAGIAEPCAGASKLAEQAGSSRSGSQLTLLAVGDLVAVRDASACTHGGVLSSKHTRETWCALPRAELVCAQQPCSDITCHDLARGSLGCEGGHHGQLCSCERGCKGVDQEGVLHCRAVCHRLGGRVGVAHNSRDLHKYAQRLRCCTRQTWLCCTPGTHTEASAIKQLHGRRPSTDVEHSKLSTPTWA